MIFYFDEIDRRIEKVNQIVPLYPGLPDVQTVNLISQLAMLRRHWRLILWSMLLVPGAVGVAVLRMTPQYTAIGSMLYDPSAALPPEDNRSNVPDTLDEDALTASQAAIITSGPVLTALSDQLKLAGRPEFQANPQRIAAAMTVTMVPNSRVLNIAFTSKDPALSAAAVNLAMQLYLQHERTQSDDQLNDAQSWLETHAAGLQNQLDETGIMLANARAAAGIVTGTQGSLTTESASQMAASLVTAEAALATAQARLDTARQGGAADANAAIAPNLLPLRKEQADLSAQVASLAGQYGADYPDLVAARTSLAAITAGIDAETAREIAAARAEVVADQAQIATLQTALQAARIKSHYEDAQAAPLEALEQRANTERAMLGDMTVQAGQLAQQAALTRPDARIISAAATPAAPDARHRVLLLTAALPLGLCLGIALAGLSEALDPSYRDGGSLRAETGLPCLALVPEIREPLTAVLDAPFAVYTEQIRALRSSLALSGHTVLAVSAARPGEGKTTLTIALARALAAAGLKVVAIDGDIRQPSFDPIFRLAGRPGLTDHLAGLASPEAIIQRDPLSSLDVIAAGAQTRDALTLFLSPALPSLLVSLRKNYDMVLLDAPPALALAEGRVLARQTEAMILCVRWHSTPKTVVRAALDALTENNVKLAGTVLTRVNPVVHGRSGFPDAEIYQPRYGGYFSK